MILGTKKISRWNKLSLVEQLINIGSEVGRTINQKKQMTSII